jgi:hypothetical protein
MLYPGFNVLLDASIRCLGVFYAALFVRYLSSLRFR